MLTFKTKQERVVPNQNPSTGPEHLSPPPELNELLFQAAHIAHEMRSAPSYAVRKPSDTSSQTAAEAGRSLMQTAESSERITHEDYAIRINARD